MIIKIIIDSINIIILSLAILICIAVLILILLRIRPLISNVPILLTCNTYISLILVNVMMLFIYAYNLYGDLYIDISVNDSWCYLRAYLTYSGYSVLYYSCLLQAIFRLFRVKFYRKNLFQSNQFYLIAIIIQWIISFLISIYNYLHYDYNYMSLEYRCWISFSNIRGLTIPLIFIYFIPLFSIIIIYRYLIRYVRQTNNIQQRRRLSNERDILVLRRIVMCVIAICALGIPTTIIWFVYIISRYVIPLAYHIQGLSLALGLIFITISFIFITPQIQDIFNKNQRRQIVPMTITRRTMRNNITKSIALQPREENL